MAASWWKNPAVIIAIVLGLLVIGIGITYAMGGYSKKSYEPDTKMLAAAPQDKCIVVKSESLQKVLPLHHDWEALPAFSFYKHGLVSPGVTPAHGHLAVNVKQGTNGAQLVIDTSKTPPKPPCARFQEWRPWLRVVDQTPRRLLKPGTFYQCASADAKMMIDADGQVHCVAKA